MSSRDNLLNDVKSCSFEEGDGSHQESLFRRRI